MPYGKKRNYGRMAKKAVSKSSKNKIVVSKPIINPVLKSYVRNVVRGSDETKQQTQATATANSILGVGFDVLTGYGWTSTVSIIPTVSQGVGQQQRVGNAIRPVGRLQVKGFVLALPVNTTNNAYSNMPFYVKVVVWRQKQDNNKRDTTGILDNGTTDQGNNFTGSLYDLMTPFNKDKYEIGASKVFMLQPNRAAAGVTTTENIGNYPLTKFFKCSVKLPKVLKYNDTNTVPMNSNWWLSVGICQNDGSSISASNIRATITADTIMRFKDS